MPKPATRKMFERVVQVLNKAEVEAILEHSKVAVPIEPSEKALKFLLQSIEPSICIEHVIRLVSSKLQEGK